jgi:hypothetical protein
MTYTRRYVLLLAVLTASTASADSAGSAASTAVAAPEAVDPWAVPVEQAPAPLPEMKSTPTVDANLHEWAGAASVPLHCRSYLVPVSPRAARGGRTHEWAGPADAGMEVYAAWSADGLCLAARVTDNSVHNTGYRQRPYTQDCVEFVIDGRQGPHLLANGPGAGLYRVWVIPPMGDRKTEAVVNKQDGVIDDLQVAGRLTAGGYAVEMLIPWKAMPAVAAKRGTRIGLGFALYDCDLVDNKVELGPSLTYQGRRNLRDPSEAALWELTDTLPAGPEAEVGPLVAIDAPSVITKEAPASDIKVEVGSALSSAVLEMRVSVLDPAGRAVLARTVSATALPEPWSRSKGGQVDWPAKAQPDGICTIRAVLLGKDGAVLGAGERPCLILRGFVEQAVQRIGKADIASMSQRDPFGAAAWLGCASALEQLKSRLVRGGMPEVAQWARQVQCRLDLLEGKDTPLPRSGMCDLLSLGRRADAQVIVECPQQDLALISLVWGSIPLAWAEVRQFPSAALAAESIEGSDDIVAAGEKITLDGVSGRLRSRRLDRDPSSLEDFDPQRDVLLLDLKGNNAIALGVDDIDILRCDAACVVPEASEVARKALEAWAARHDRPLQDLEEALRHDRVLVAGDIKTEALADTIRGMRKRRGTVVDTPAHITLVARDRTVMAVGADRSVAERVARMVLAGRPVTAEQVDELRAAVVKALVPKGGAASRPAATKLYCGDLHSHTFYSDGNCSPAGLALEAIYCGLDFLVMTDHNTIHGAQLAHRQLREHGLDYPLIVGEEVTASFHMNVFPLTEKFPWNLSEDKTIALAHERNAYVQWNHPGFPEPNAWGLAHLKDGISDTSLDAWEHMPAQYEVWRQAGRPVPVLSGTTDTHDCTFAGYSERTIVLASSTDGSVLAAALREGKSVAVLPSDARLLYNAEANVNQVWAALAEGKQLKAAKREQLKAALKKADVAGLIRDSDAGLVFP